MIVFSDLHLREDTADICLEEVLPGIYEAALADDGHVAFLGDFYTIRYKINVSLQNAVLDEFRRWSGVDVRMIPGNHDQISVDGRNALEVFDEVHNVDVYTHPSQDDFGLWMPYRKHPEEVVHALQTLGGDTLWMHQGVVGAMMNNHIKDSTGMGLDVFESFEHVYSGHYHKRHMLGHVVYVGSPYQTKADEHGQPKGYGVWNPDTGVMSFVDMNWGPRYHVFTVEAGHTPDLSAVQDGDDLRIKVIGKGSQKASEELGQYISEKLNVKHAIVPEIEANQARMDVPEGASLYQYAMEYAKMHADASELPEKGLLEALDVIVGEA